MKNKTLILIQIIALTLVFIVLCGIGAAVVFRMDRSNGFMFSLGNIFDDSKMELSQTNSFNGIESINVDALSYSIYVEEHSASDVVIEEYISKLGNQKENETYKEGNTLYFKQAKNFGIVNVNYGKIVIKVPKGSSLSYDVKTLSGTVELDAKSKGAYLDTVSGSIKAYQEGTTVKANSTSGSIKIYAPFNEIKADSISGSVKVIANRNTTEIDAGTVSGSIKIALLDKVGYKMKYSSVSGSVKDEYSGARYSKNGTAKQGDQQIDIDASTVSGSIKFEDWN